MALAAFDILGPIAHVLVGIEYQIGGAWHVVLAFTFAHEVVRAVALVRMVANVTVLFRASDLVSWKRAPTGIRILSLQQTVLGTYDPW